MRLFLLALCFFVLPASVYADGESCLLPILRSFSPRLYKASEDFRTIDPALIRGETIPKWADFAKLQQILEDARAGKKLLIEAGKVEELNQVFAEIAKSYSEDAQTGFLKTLRKDAKLTTQYRPTEYVLKREYQSLLWQINRELPKEMKIPGVRLPVDLRLPGLLADGKKLVKAQEAFFESHIVDYGYKDMNEFNEALSKQSDLARSLKKMFDSEDVEMAMNRPENARWWVPRVGFQNQRVTGSSRGTLDNELRSTSESRMMNVDLESYKKLDDQLKPNFGYLRPTPESGMAQSTEADRFGSDTFIFKKEKVHDRLTWTSGNSLGTPYYFIPWKDRNLVIPDLLEKVGDENLGFFASFPKLPYPKLEKPIPPKLDLEDPMSVAYPIQPPIDVPYPVRPQEPPYPNFPPDPPYNFPAGTVDRTPPSMPPLAKGETFAEGLKKYKESPAYLAYQKQVQDDQIAAQKAIDDYNKRPEVMEYNKKVKDIMDEYAKVQAAYQQSKEYLEYTDQLQKYEAQVTKIQTDFAQGPEMKAYQDAVNGINTRNQAKVNALHATPEWAAYVQQKLAYNTKFLDVVQSDQFKWMKFNSKSNPFGVWAGTPLEKFHKAQTVGYVELQYWGPTTLDDVAAFEFRGNPPSGEFLQELLRRGIKIRDGRVSPSVEWKPTP